MNITPEMRRIAAGIAEANPMEQPNSVYSSSRSGEGQTAARPLADVLWEAANVYLPLDTFSCHAVRSATPRGELGAALSFMRELGCPPHACHCPAWDWLYGDEEDMADERLRVRYMWLLLAMHVAEDEGVML